MADDRGVYLLGALTLARAVVVAIDDARLEPARQEALAALVGPALEQMAILVACAADQPVPCPVSAATNAGEDIEAVSARTRPHAFAAAHALRPVFDPWEGVPPDVARRRVRDVLSELAVQATAAALVLPRTTSPGGCA